MQFGQIGSVHILRNQVGRKGGLLKMLMLDYGGGGGVSGYDDISQLKNWIAHFFMFSFYFSTVLLKLYK